MTDTALDAALAATADLTSHHIEGYARMARDGGHFRCPLITNVTGNLWQGGTPAEVGALPDYFEYVVNLYPWEAYRRPPETVYVEARLYDAGDVPEIPKLFALADAVNAFRKLGPTLVHCQAGLNRSALVTGIALIRDGMTPRAAVELLRRRSPAVLCNPAFEGFLLGHGEWT